MTVRLETDRIYLGDAEQVLKESIPDGSVDMILTSPPYDDMRKYGIGGGGWCFEKFKSIANELYRVLKDGGVMVWVVNDKTEKGSESGTSFRHALYFKEIGFNLNDTMIWLKKNPLPVLRSTRYSPAFEYMFVFSKGKVLTFNPLKVPCKCGGRDYKSTCKKTGGENGRQYKEFKINKEKVMGNVWEIAVAQNKTGHPATFPMELAVNHIKSWSNEGEVVLDPFMGSGTTALAAIETGRRYVGIELSKEYYNLISRRIEEKR